MERVWKYDADMRLKVAGSVKGLICISTLSDRYNPSICICNPFLGQFKNLPPHSPSHSCEFSAIRHHVGVGFDEDYKVVHLLSCYPHQSLQAYLYSRRMNSWRELAVDQQLFIYSPIKSLCKNGSFAHWLGWCTRGLSLVILSFYTKNEVLQTFTISGDQVLRSFNNRLEILAKDECSFVLFGLDNEMVKVYESRVEGSELMWTHMMDVAQHLFGNICLFGVAMILWFSRSVIMWF